MFCVVRAVLNCLVFEVIISGRYARIIKPNGALSSLRSQGVLSRPSKFELFILFIYLFITSPLHNMRGQVQ